MRALRVAREVTERVKSDLATRDLDSLNALVVALWGRGMVRAAPSSLASCEWGLLVAGGSSVSNI